MGGERGSGGAMAWVLRDEGKEEDRRVCEEKS